MFLRKDKEEADQIKCTILRGNFLTNQMFIFSSQNKNAYYNIYVLWLFL